MRLPMCCCSLLLFAAIPDTGIAADAFPVKPVMPTDNAPALVMMSL